MLLPPLFVSISSKLTVLFPLLFFFWVSHCTASFRYYEGWNFNSGNYLFTTDTK